MPGPPNQLRTPFCRTLGIEHPILSVGMGQAAGPELASAVSNAGGFGVLGMSGMDPEEMRRLIGLTRALTRRPFGVNVIIDVEEEGDRQLLLDQVAVAAEETAAVVLFWGDPAPYVEEVHRHGSKVLIQVGSVEEAKSAAKAGVDAVIAQGYEAGGHVRGTTSIWELLPATVEAINPVPVLASGSIGDGEGLARALDLGALAVSLGTRFVASDEAWLHPSYKQRIVEATAADTVLNELYDVWWPNAPHRTLRNKTLAEWEAAGRPPPGERRAREHPSGERACPREKRSTGPGTPSARPHPTSTVTSSTRRCGRESRSRSSTT